MIKKRIKIYQCTNGIMFSLCGLHTFTSKVGNSGVRDPTIKNTILCKTSWNIKYKKKYWLTTWLSFNEELGRWGNLQYLNIVITSCQIGTPIWIQMYDLHKKINSTEYRWNKLNLHYDLWKYRVGDCDIYRISSWVYRVTAKTGYTV